MPGQIQTLAVPPNVSVDTLLYAIYQAASSGGGGGSTAWGSITGTLSNQTDLQTALNAKLSISALGTGVETALGIAVNTTGGFVTFGGDPTFGIATVSTRVITPEIKASGSGGVDIHNNGGTQVAIFGAGGGTGISLVGTTNIGSASADYFQLAGGTGTITNTATGSSTNISINLVPKGSGTLQSAGTSVALLSTNTFTGAQIFSVNGAASTPAITLSGTIFTGGSATTTKPQLLIEPSGATTNNWSTSGTGLGVNAASGFAGNLIDLQVNADRKFSVASNGQATAAAMLTVTGSAGSLSNLTFYWDGNANIWSAGGINLFGSNVSIGGFGGTVSLFYDTTNTLAQRSSTNAQTFRVYGTYTDASNYRRLALGSNTSGVFTIKAEGAGTGASGNVIHLSSLPTSNPGAGILWNDGGTPAIGT